MQVPLVMTVIARDRTGLVKSIARIVAEHDDNWLESRMCRLGGEFAGILRVQVPQARRDDLERALNQLENLSVVIRPDEPAPITDPRSIISLEILGPDRPGIVREITSALASLGVNVEELATECLSAPMSGEQLFKAHARLYVPADVARAALRESLERASADIGVEFSLL